MSKIFRAIRHQLRWAAVMSIWLTASASIAAECPDNGAAARVGEDRLHITCTPVAPVIDGVMEPEIWDSAALITDFTQVDPVEGAAPSERTEARILYDADAIYLFLRAYVSDPDDIVATIRERDGDLVPDDRFVVIFDTFGRRRDGYSFIVNPLGSRRDLLLESNRNIYGEWDAIWHAETRIDDAGWTAEIEIPVKSLAFADGPQEWGFNISRRIKHLNEEVRWTNIRQDLQNVNVSQIGKMRGMEGLDQGLGLDVKVAGAVGYLDDKVMGKSGFEIDPSLDIFYKITPSVTGALTFNTDFAEAAVDERKVNLTRFNLFFPETRDFFLQDVGVFEFADLEGNDVNGRPFFTRSIGLTPYGIVDILGGGKVTGRVGELNFGVLSVQTDSAPELGLESENLTVARASLNVLEESQVGAIVTRGNPLSGPGNAVYGLDFRFQDNSFMGRNQTLNANAWYLRADSAERSGGEHAFGAYVGSPGDRFEWAARLKEIGPNYRPAMGFVNRWDIREYKAFGRLRWRPDDSMFRTIDWREFGAVITDRDNELETLRFNSEIKVTTDADDSLALDLRFTRERLNSDFLLPKGLFVPRGDYNFMRPRLTLATTRSRPLSVLVKLECCDYFTGKNKSLELKVDYKPSPLFFFSLRYDHYDISLPSGDGTIRIGGLEANINFTPDLQWANLIQYDNVSRDVGINSRLRWIITPGSEFFLIVNQNFLEEDWDIRSQRSEAIFKIGHTFRM